MRSSVGASSTSTIIRRTGNHSLRSAERWQGDWQADPLLPQGGGLFRCFYRLPRLLPMRAPGSVDPVDHHRYLEPKEHGGGADSSQGGGGGGQPGQEQVRAHHQP